MGESEDDFALKPLFWRQQDVMCDSPKLTVVSMIMTEGEMPYVAFAFAPEWENDYRATAGNFSTIHWPFLEGHSDLIYLENH